MDGVEWDGTSRRVRLFVSGTKLSVPHSNAAALFEVPFARPHKCPFTLMIRL